MESNFVSSNTQPPLPSSTPASDQVVFTGRVVADAKRPRKLKPCFLVLFRSGLLRFFAKPESCTPIAEARFAPRTLTSIKRVARTEKGTFSGETIEVSVIRLEDSKSGGSQTPAGEEPDRLSGTHVPITISSTDGDVILHLFSRLISMIEESK